MNFLSILKWASLGLSIAANIASAVYSDANTEAIIDKKLKEREVPQIEEKEP